MEQKDNHPEMPGGAWRLLPHLYAERMSKGAWQAWDYLHLIGTEIAAAVLSGNGRLIVEAPVRHGKSLLISHWVPIWFLDMFPEKNVALATYESEFAAHWGRGVRNQIQGNDQIAVQIRQDSSAANRWETVQNGGMVTVGIGGPLTGRGFHLGVVDDPVKNWEEATSSTIRERNKNWFQSTWMTRAEPGATVVVLMARWHEDDVAGWLQREHGDVWKTIRIPAIAEEDDPVGRKPGEALCPSRYSRRQLLGEDGQGGIKRAVGPIIWNGLYRQRPSSLEGGVVRREYFRHWTQIPQGLTLAMSIDCAFEKTDTSSFVVIQIWGRKGAERYLLDQVRKRMDFVETVEAIQEMAKRWPAARLKLIEAKANGAAVVSQMRSKISGLVKYMPRGSKIARLAAVSPAFASNNVYLPLPHLADWVRDYIEELVNMPNSPNDDQADATSQILDHWEKQVVAVAPGGGNTRISPISVGGVEG